MNHWQQETGLKVMASDGAILAADVYRPSDKVARPVVLLRTYLGKDQHRAEAAGWVRHGFACVVQDVRGRFESEGDWQPYCHERRDGRATVEWLLAQPWCDGRVVAVGGSYAAFAAWSAAVAHPSVRAVISSVPAMGPMPMQPADGGVLPLLSRLNWWLTHAGSRRPRTSRVDTLRPQSLNEILSHLPVADLPDALSASLSVADLPTWRREVLATESADRTAPIHDAELAGLDVAGLHLGGWHDPFCAETLRQFEWVGRAHSPRPPRNLVIGPWWHHLNGAQPAQYGERDYGPASRFPLGKFQASWLQGVLNGTAPQKPTVRIFLGGENRWIKTPEWSSPAIETRTFFPCSDRLSETPPSGSGQRSMTYDPQNPCPCRRTPLDERSLPERSDVLVFTGEPLRRPCRVIGTPRVTLWGSTDAASVDWVARLLEVTADGRRLYLAHGVVDAGRQLTGRGESLLPKICHRVDLVLTPLGVTVPKGSRLRLEIANSAFPSYARNLGSGESRLTGHRPRKSQQTVFWRPNMPTRLELPVHVAINDAIHPPIDHRPQVGERL